MRSRSRPKIRKQLFSLLLSLAMLSSLLVISAAAKGPEDAVAPVYNAAENVYEISTPAQLMYLSGTWKEGAPRDGNYVLTADIDMAGWEGFKPIASEKEEGYLGTFDGRFHAIRNLTIDYPKKYVGLFGYVGNENDQAYVKNVAMIDCEIRGQQNVGGIAGVTYGTITGCVVTGHVWVDDLSNSHTSGGIAGKVKEGEGPIIGHVENCYVDAKLEAPYDVGGIAGIQDGGGYVGNSFAAGSVNAYGENGSAGGIAGSFNAGDHIVGCVSAQTSISGTKNVDKIVGQLDDEAATNISGNIAWEGTLLAGNEPAFQPIQWEDVSAQVLQTKQTDVDLGWDFDKVWTWSDTLQQPILQGYDPAIFEALDFTVDGPRVISRAINEVDQNAKVTLTARVAGVDAVESAVLHYGYDSVDAELPMTISGTTCTVDLPTGKAGDMYYYLEIQAGGKTVTKPYDKSAPIQVFVDDGSILGDPSQITMTPDTTQGSLRFSWITVPEVKASVVQYKKQGESTWKTARGTSYVDAVTPGWKELATHQVVLEDLEPDAMYVYRVGDGKDFMSEEHTFKAPTSPDADEFSFIFVSDPQSVSTDDYMSFKKSMDYATTLVTPEFIMSGGDTTQDGYKATEWEACFEVMGDYFASIPTITVPGNHEMKGDWGLISFAQRFNMPGGDTGTEFDGTIGCIEYGDACIVVINTEVTPPEEKADIIAKQLQWAKECYEKSDKKWRIMLTHAGPYTSNHPASEVIDYFINDSAWSVDALGVDLFLNGHDHIYIRATALGDVKANTGDGTTYVTGGTVGNKYYEYLPDRSDYATDCYVDDKDQQVFSIITVPEDTITGKAYQCQDSDTDEKEEMDQWNNWKVVDSYEIRNTVRDGKKVTDYTDVKSGDWYYDAAAFVTENKLVSGEEAYRFGGNEIITRAEAAQALYNLAGRPDCQLTTAFTDVTERSQQRDAISWVYQQGIMLGTGDGVFSPDRPLTRGMFATILARYAKLQGKDMSTMVELSTFTDAASIPGAYADGVRWCAANKIVEGRSDGTFVSQASLTRAHMSTMLMRFVQLDK